MEKIEKIKKMGERWNSSLKSIGKMMDEIADKLDEALPKELGEFEFEAYGIVFRRWGPYSNVGSFGPAFWTPRGELLSTTREPEDGFYLHGDFNVYINVASRKKRREAAKNLPDFLDELAKFLEKQTAETEMAEKLLKKMIEAARA